VNRDPLSDAYYSVSWMWKAPTNCRSRRGCRFRRNLQGLCRSVFELYWRDHTGISGEVELEPSFALAQLYRYCAPVIAHRRNRPKA